VGRFGVNVGVVDSHISRDHCVFADTHDWIVRLRIHPIERLTNDMEMGNYKKDRTLITSQ
jgi:hypothetical protein